MKSSVHLYLDACVTESLRDALQFLARHFFKILGRGLAVNAIEHDLTRIDLEIGTQEGIQFLIGGIVKAISVKFATDHNGLHYTLTIESLEVGNDSLGETIGRNGAIDSDERVGNGAVEFEDIIIHLAQGFCNLGLACHGRIAEHRHLGIGEVLGAQTHHVFHNLLELGMQRGFTIAREGDDIKGLALMLHLFKFTLELVLDGLACGYAILAGSLGVEAGLTIEAVKGTNLAIVGHEVDTE